MSKYDTENILNSSELIKNIIYYDEISSTNSIAKEILNKDMLKDNFLVLANCQTKGRGKNNVHFFSPAEVGIYMSVVLVKPKHDLRVISAVTSLAILKAIKKFIDEDIKIKWPNDILVNGKKACGILIEASAQSEDISLDNVIIGIGFNVNNEYFDPSIESIATSLKKESGKTINRSEIIREILTLLKCLLSKSPRDLIEEYLENMEEKSLNNIVKSKDFVGLLKLLDS